MSNEDVAIAAPSRELKTDAASRSLSSLSISDFASAVKGEPQPQQQAAAKQAKKAAAKKQRSKSGASSAAITATASPSSSHNKNSNASAGNQSGAKRKTTTTAASAKSKKADSSNKAKTPNATKNGKEQSAAVAPASATFVPVHMPVWKPDVGYVNDGSIPIAKRLVAMRSSACGFVQARLT